MAIALFLILRNDHDGSYNKNEKRGLGAEKSRYEKRTPKAEFKAGKKNFWTSSTEAEEQVQPEQDDKDRG